jgi:hypothetical protein
MDGVVMADPLLGPRREAHEHKLALAPDDARQALAICTSLRDESLARQEVTVAGLAREAGLTAAWFGERFKQRTGACRCAPSSRACASRRLADCSSRALR